jgi:hypothetical protein
MAQKTNLNINPYFDDFDSDKNFHKVLFKPGYPVQSRELTTLQSILQNQFEEFGGYVFKDGSQVRPGGHSYDNEYYAVKVNTFNLGIDISVYIDQFVGKTIKGLSSEITAEVKQVVMPDDNDVTNITLYVKYINSDKDYIYAQFPENETLYSLSDVVYGNTTITAGSSFATTLDINPCSTGSSASISSGSFFIRGYFVNVPESTIILDHYTNTPSYRVGLKIEESIVSAKNDESLFDNAKGFSNYSAPGADRFKITLSLAKKLLTDNNDTNFIELFRVIDGEQRDVAEVSQLSELGNYIAKRIYEESGHFTVTPFEIVANESLDDKQGNGGLFTRTKTTDQQNTPSDDLVCLTFSPGKAYVKGFRKNQPTEKIIDVKKPRTTAKSENHQVPFEMGNLVKVFAVTGGIPTLGSSLDLKGYDGTTLSDIGTAKIYNFNLTSTEYVDASTNWDLYLYDIQTFTVLDIPTNTPAQGDYVKGASTGATGFVKSISGSDVTLHQTSGKFVPGETIITNGLSKGSVVKEVTEYNFDDVVQVLASGGGFQANTVQSTSALIGGATQAELVQSTGVLTASPGQFLNLNLGDLVSLGGVGVFRVSARTDESEVTLNTIFGSNVSLPSDGTYQVSRAKTLLGNQSRASLYSTLAHSNIESLDLSNTSLTVNSLFEVEIVNGTATLNNGTDSESASGYPVVKGNNYSWTAYDEENYSLFDSSNEPVVLRRENITIDGNNLTISGIANGTYNIIAAVVKKGIDNNIKLLQKSAIQNIIYTQNENSSNYRKYYGTRIQDKEISLNYPDVVNVVGVYENSKTGTSFTLDKITIDSSLVSNSLIGEYVESTTGKAIARIIDVHTDQLEIAYLNNEKFSVGTSVRFESSFPELTPVISEIELGKFKNITSSYTLNNGHTGQYQDYSRIVRNRNSAAPTRAIKVVFDHYILSSSSTGDIISVGSYDSNNYSKNIATISSTGERVTDILDFRPIVPYFDPTTNRSPFAPESRTASPSIFAKPQESAPVTYNYYLPRVDKIFLNKNGVFIVEQGEPSLNPTAPSNKSPDDMMELATLFMPAYLYDAKDIQISMVDNRRYTMRDIGRLEDRIDTLEETTTLSLLELNTENLQVLDSNLNNRFKSGFFADNFRTKDFVNEDSSVDVNSDIRPQSVGLSVPMTIIPADGSESPDYDKDFALQGSGMKKTGELITLDYESVSYIEQPLATRVENVNPFHVIEYKGSVNLTPRNDTGWVLQTTSSGSRNFGTVGAGGASRTQVWTTQNITQWSAPFMRAKNIQVVAEGMKPLTRYYQFFGSQDENVIYTPQLVEISPSSTLSESGSANAAFQDGETVIVYSDNGEIHGRMRLKSANFKTETPSELEPKTYNINPYDRNNNLPSSYSQSSPVICIDAAALSRDELPQFWGYIQKGYKLVGQSSGAEAWIKDKRIVSDNYGYLRGSFYIRGPFRNTDSSNYIQVGTKTYKLTSSSTNQTPLRGSTAISLAETTFTSTGIRRNIETITNVITVRYGDPLAQSFIVGSNIQAPDFTEPRDDDSGVFITAVDIFFGTKPSGDQPVTCEIRPVEFGTPTREVVGKPVTLRSNDVNISTTGEIATKFTFPEPIFLEPGRQYAVVLIADTTTDYEVWVARMGEKTVNTQSLPDAESVMYTKQFALGRLYKSQNGGEWTGSDTEDMKMKLYKAKFTETSGTAFFGSPAQPEMGKLTNDSIMAYSQTGRIVVDSPFSSVPALGSKVYGNNGSNFENIGEATVAAIGGEVLSAEVTVLGDGYANSGTAVSTRNISGVGEGLELTWGTSLAVSSTFTIADAGKGYTVGDTVSLVTSTGRGIIITITGIQNEDTLYVYNVIGDSGSTTADQVFAEGVGLYSDAARATTSIGTLSNDAEYKTSIPFQIPTGDPNNPNSDIPAPYTGDIIAVNHYNHGMYAINNKVEIKGIESDLPLTTLDSEVLVSQNQTITLADNGADYGKFEGFDVDESNPGYVKIGDEIISYTGATVNTGNNKVTLSLGSSPRGIDFSDGYGGGAGKAQSHVAGSIVSKYEFAGVSLRRINRIHEHTNFAPTEVPSGIESVGIDHYHIKIDTTNTRGVDRSVNSNTLNFTTNSVTVQKKAPILKFNNFRNANGENIEASQNFVFDTVTPDFVAVNVGEETSITSNLRTVSGTSVSGSESSFVNSGFVPVEIGSETKLSSVRLYTSRVNSVEHLGEVDSKPLTGSLTFTTKNENLSPAILLDGGESKLILSTNRINQPMTDFASASSIKSIDGDPHSAVYISSTTNLQHEAKSLKVFLNMYRPGSSDVRVLYRLVRPGSDGVNQEFELFPGFKNLNDGTSDVQIIDSVEDEYYDYEYTVDNLPEFTGFSIKVIMSGTNQAEFPIIRDIRSIALA